MFANIHKKRSTGPQIIYFVKVLFNSLTSTGFLLCFLFIGCYAVSNEISRFLNENGFGNLGPRFVDQEVEVQQIPAMADHLLVELGVRTIESRLRIGSAASHWLENQGFFVDLDIVCFLILLPISAPAR